MTLAVSDIKKALKKKGFVPGPKKRDHVWFEYPDSLISTKVSHGSGETLGDPLIVKMAAQIKLRPQEFVDLVKCPLSKEDYKAKMIANGSVIPPSEEDEEEPKEAQPQKPVP